jgi:5-methylcytosine-specific restriction endonuclease McrA
MLKRLCKWCGTPLPIENKRIKPFCSDECYDKEYYQRNKEIFLERAEEFRNSSFGKEYRKKYFKKYFSSPRGKNARKKYLQSQKGKEHKKEQSKKYNSSQHAKEMRKNRDQTTRGKEIKRKNDKKYKQSIKGKEAGKRYWKSPKGKLAKFKYYCRRKQQYPIDISLEDEKFIRKRDGMRCIYCGIEVFNYPIVPQGSPQEQTFDHINNKGATDRNNLVIACRDCNNSKNDTDVFEWCKQKNRPIPKIILKTLNNN